jgi:hypothetical protein
MSFECNETLNPNYESDLRSWVEKARDSQDEELYDLWGTEEGLHVELEGIYLWAFKVKVKRPWKLFGKETLELHGIYESNQRFPIIDALSAEELIDAAYGSPLVWLPRNIYEQCWMYDLAYCENADWAEAFGGEDWNSSLYRKLDLNEDAWTQKPTPFKDGDKVSRSILGFEDEESTLASIRYWNNMFLDGASGPANADLNTIQLLDTPILKLNGQAVPDTQVKPLLQRAAELFNEELH